MSDPRSVVTETWIVERESDLPERLKFSEGTYYSWDDAMERARHLNSIGTPGILGIRKQVKITLTYDVEWLSEALVIV